MNLFIFWLPIGTYLEKSGHLKTCFLKSVGLGPLFSQKSFVVVEIIFFYIEKNAKNFPQKKPSNHN